MDLPAPTGPADAPLGIATPTVRPTDAQGAESATVPLRIEEFQVPQGSRPHDVAPAPDGSVWYTAQRRGELGRLDPVTGETHHIPLGQGSAPHGVILDPDGNAWVTDGGQNAIVRVGAVSEEVAVFPLPAGTPRGNLNTAAFDGMGDLWFTGQNGIYGRLSITRGDVVVFQAPRGPGPYGITSTPAGDVYYASLANSYVGRIDLSSGSAEILEPPTPDQGARRVWSDSQGRIWVSEWNTGQVAVFDPGDGTWVEWALPGERPRAYAVYVDNRDMVWLSDFGSNAIMRFDPRSEMFTVIPIPSPGAEVRQILGRPGEVWAAESATDKLILIRTE